MESLAHQRSRACLPAGNVLHVHDLVDYVSEEASAAGRAAAAFVAAGCKDGARKDVPITFEGGPRYTVPGTVDTAHVGDSLTVRYRVGGVMKDRMVRVLMDGDAVISRKRPVMAPGEMEEIHLTKAMFDAHPGLKQIHIKVEEA
jgi:hypothetical protein